MKALIAAALLVAAAPAHAALMPPPVVAHDATIRPAPKGLPATAAYLTLKSLRDRPERLLSVSCGCAARVEAHQTTQTGGVMHMAPAAVVVPPKGEVRFAPGGLHLMVMGLKRPIHAGDTVTMRLTFDHASPVVVRFKAQP